MTCQPTSATPQVYWGTAVTIPVTVPDTVDLTGATVLWAFKVRPGTDLDDETAAAKGEAVVTGPHTATISLDADTSRTLEARTYLLGLKIVPAAGSPFPTSDAELAVVLPVVNREGAP